LRQQAKFDDVIEEHIFGRARRWAFKKPNAHIWRSAFWNMRPSGHFHKVWITAAKGVRD
jgi:hypothetical protein